MSNLEQSIVESGLLCFGPFNTKASRLLFKYRIMDLISEKKKLFKSKDNIEEDAQEEFEIRRFCDKGSSAGSSTDVSTSTASTDEQIYAELDLSYEALKKKMKKSRKATLDNLQLQSKVYRDEIESLKRQITNLRFERQQLSSELIPLVKRRRSHFKWNKKSILYLWVIHTVAISTSSLKMKGQVWSLSLSMMTRKDLAPFY